MKSDKINTKDKVKKNIRLSGFVGVISLFSVSAFGGMENSYWGSYVEHFVDFSTTTLSGHQTWATWQPPSGSANTRYFRYNFNGSSGGRCYQLQFATVSGTESNTDIQLFTPNQGVAVRSLDDNGPNGNKLPNAGIWVPHASLSWITISAKSPSFNNVDFKMISRIVTNLNGTLPTHSDQCRTALGGSTPFYNAGTGELYNANSLSN